MSLLEELQDLTQKAVEAQNFEKIREIEEKDLAYKKEFDNYIREKVEQIPQLLNNLKLNLIHAAKSGNKSYKESFNIDDSKCDNPYFNKLRNENHPVYIAYINYAKENNLKYKIVHERHEDVNWETGNSLGWSYTEYFVEFSW